MDLLDNRLRLNPVLFYGDYEELQVEVAQPSGVLAINAPTAELWGFELDLEAVPTNRLNLRGNVSIIPHAEYGDYPFAFYFFPNPEGGNIEVIDSGDGQRMVLTPKFTVNAGGDYTVPVGYGSLRFSANYYYNDGFYWTATNRIKDSYHLVNAAVTWFSQDEHWSVRVWARNAFDDEYFTEASVSGLGDGMVAGAPRTYGISVRYEY